MTIFSRSIAIAGALMITTTASAAVSTFTGSDDGAGPGGTFTNSDAAAAEFFAAALTYSPLLTTGFETVPTGFSTTYALPAATVTLNAVDFGEMFSGVTNYQATVDPALYGFDVGDGTGNWLGFPNGSATFDFDGTTHAFGFYATGVQTTFGLDFLVTYDNGVSQAFSAPVNTDGGVSFFGLVDTDSFASITISRPGNDAWGIDNVSYGFPTLTPEVPEPASWAMMIAGFGLVGAAMRRRQTAAFAA